MSMQPILVAESASFGKRQRSASSISPEQALIHMVKVMLGTGMLSLPQAFRYSGLYVRKYSLFLL